MLPPEAGPVQPVVGGVEVALRVTPRAAQQRAQGLVRDAAGRLRIKIGVTAAPEDGRANEAVIRLLAKAWGVPRSSLDVISGRRDRSKLLRVAGDPAALAARLSAWIETLSKSEDT